MVRPGTIACVTSSSVEDVQEPTEQPYDGRDCAFGDPAGNLVRVNATR